jgi:ribosomal protein L11 methyltransferase
MFQLQIEQCHRDEIELLSDALEETGALSITLTDQYDDPILEPAPGAAPLWPNVVVNALYTEENDANIALVIVSEAFSHLNYSIHGLPDQDWERTCLDQFKPQQFGKRLWVCPSWLTPPDPNAVNLILDPGLAFGTGSHATTSLCLTWLDQAKLEAKQIIDYGCGSGILALAALKLGAQHVHAVDIDEQALLATRDNAVNNDIATTELTVGQPDTLNEPVDVLIANILLAPLLALKSRFHELLKDEGMLVVSGLLAEQVPILIEAYQADFVHSSTHIEMDWALVVFCVK